jgi:UDP-N-acetylglucosamine 2-epimerase (non-hydrolysing)
MKVAPLHRAFSARSASVRHLIVHTGQHYDEKMSKVFFEDLQLPQPDIYLGVGSGSHAEQTAKVMVEFEKVVLEVKPDLVLVVGDVNSTLACSIVAAKLHVPVAHVEAGLRSFDRRMPEEINRLVTDAIADLHFVTEPSGMEHLRSEGVPAAKVYLVGNTMIDSLAHFREAANRSAIVSDLGLAAGRYMVVTLHRPSNVDRKEILQDVLGFFEKFASQVSAVFPVHPRTRKMLSEFGLMERASKVPGLKLIDPLGYLDFLRLMQEARFVLTDSGGIQEETTYLGIPCLTLRENTERPITVAEGSNVLCGSVIANAMPHVESILAGRFKRGRNPDLWDGKAAERIVEIIVAQLKERT